MDPVVLDVTMRYDSRRDPDDCWQCNIGKDASHETFAGSYQEAVRLSLESYWRGRRERAIKVAAEAEFLERLFDPEGK